mgnify:FL=1
MSSQLDAIKARAEAATEGPWRVRTDYIPGVIEVEGPTASNDYVAELSADKADLEFIAHSRADIPALVAAVEAALNMPGEVVECGYPLDSEWASGYTAALVDVRAVIRQALGEVGK